MQKQIKPITDYNRSSLWSFEPNFDNINLSTEIVVTLESGQFILDQLENPPEPNKAMMALFDNHIDQPQNDNTSCMAARMRVTEGMTSFIKFLL